MRELQGLVEGRPPPSAARMMTAVITRSDAGGIFAAPLGGDQRHPLGPCRGGTYLRGPTAPGLGGEGHRHTLQRVPLPVGALVLLALTRGAPWIAAFELPESEET